MKPIIFNVDCREQNGVYLDPAQYEQMKGQLECLVTEKESWLVKDAQLEEKIAALGKITFFMKGSSTDFS